MTLHVSIESEQGLLACPMHDTDALDAASDIRGEHFSDARHAAIWRAITDLRADGTPIDPITICSKLGRDGAEMVGGVKYLADLLHSIPSARNAGAYAAVVRTKHTRRELLRAAQAVLELAQSDSGSVAETVDAASALIAGVQRGRTRKAPRHIAEIALARTGHYEDVQDGKVPPGWPVGIGSIDRVAKLGPGKLIVIAARPGVGKSSIAAQMLISMAKDGRTGLFLSQEMEDEEVADRMIASHGRIESARMDEGRMDAEDWSRAVEAIESMQHLPIYIDDQGGLMLSDIRAKIMSVPGIKAVVLDYVQLCSTSGDNLSQGLGEITRGLKALAKELGCCVIVLSQLNRDCEKRPGGKPIMSDLRASGEIEQDADIIILMYEHRVIDDDASVVGAIVAKNRKGKKPTLALHFDKARQRWAESTDSLAEEPEKPRARRGIAQ